MTHYHNTKKLRLYQTSNWFRGLIIPWGMLCVFLMIYAIVVLLGPISWTNTRQHWPTGECIFTNDTHPSNGESHYYSVSFTVHWSRDGIPTTSKGTSPSILGNNVKDLPPDFSGDCTIDPSTMEEEGAILSVWPEIWLHEWHIRYWFWLSTAISLSLLSAVGLTLCYVTRPLDTKIATIQNAEEIRQSVEKGWSKSLKKLSAAQPLLHDNLMIGDAGPFGGNVFTCAVKEQDLIFTGDYDLEPMYNAKIEDLSLISDHKIESLVQHFYDNLESDLRSGIMSWLEKSGVIPKLLARDKPTTPPQVSEESLVDSDDEYTEEIPRWSLIETTSSETKTPRDTVLRYSAQPSVHNRWFLSVIGCLVVALIFISAFGSICFLVWNSVPTYIGSAPFFTGMLGIAGVLFASGIEVTFIVIIHMVCEQLIQTSGFFRMLTHRYEWNWFLKVDYLQGDKFYTISSGEFFTVLTTRYNISIKRIRLLDEPVWICAVTPKPPSEISFSTASVLTFATNM